MGKERTTNGREQGGKPAVSSLNKETASRYTSCLESIAYVAKREKEKNIDKR
jgi:hypothetical protein